MFQYSEPCSESGKERYAEALEEVCIYAVIDLVTSKWFDGQLKKQKAAEAKNVIIDVWKSIISELIKDKNDNGKDFTNGKVLQASELCRHIEMGLFSFGDDGVINPFYNYFHNPDLDFRLFSENEENDNKIEIELKECQNSLALRMTNRRDEFWWILAKYMDEKALDKRMEQIEKVEQFFSVYPNFACEMEEKYRVNHFECEMIMQGAESHSETINRYFQYYENHLDKIDDFNANYAKLLGRERYLEKVSELYNNYFKKYQSKDLKKWLTESGDTEILEFYEKIEGKMILPLFLVIIGKISKEDYWYLTEQLGRREYEKWNAKISFEEYLNGYFMEKMHILHLNTKNVYRGRCLNTREQRIQEEIRNIIIRNVFSPDSMKKWLLFHCVDKLISEEITFCDGKEGDGENESIYCEESNVYIPEKIKDFINVAGDLRFVKKKVQTAIGSTKYRYKNRTEEELEIIKDKLAAKNDMHLVYGHQLQCFEFITDNEGPFCSYDFFSAEGKSCAVHAFCNINDMFQQMRCSYESFDPKSDYYLNQFVLFDSSVEFTYGCLKNLRIDNTEACNGELDQLLEKIVLLQNSVKFGVGKMIKECFSCASNEKLSIEESLWFLEQMNLALSERFCNGVGEGILGVQREFYVRLMENGWECIDDNPLRYRGELEWNQNFYSNLQRLLKQIPEYSKKQDRVQYLSRVKKNLYNKNISEILRVLHDDWKSGKEVSEELRISQEAWEYFEKSSGTPKKVRRDKESNLYKKIQGELIQKNYIYKRKKK